MTGICSLRVLVARLPSGAITTAVLKPRASSGPLLPQRGVDVSAGFAGQVACEGGRRALEQWLWPDPGREALRDWWRSTGKVSAPAGTRGERPRPPLSVLPRPKRRGALQGRDASAAAPPRPGPAVVLAGSPGHRRGPETPSGASSRYEFRAVNKCHDRATLAGTCWVMQCGPPPPNEIVRPGVPTICRPGNNFDKRSRASSSVAGLAAPANGTMAAPLQRYRFRYE